ncbi:MAG TPA: GspE/PulE family protein [Xanthomonadaceae bacterium]
MSTDDSMQSGITVDTIRAARARAGQSGKSWLHVLQEQSGLDESGFLSALAAFSCMTPMSSVDLFASTADLDIAPFIEFSRRNCIVVRNDDGRHCLIVSDPLEEGVIAWANSRTDGTCRVRLVHADALRAFLAQVEQSVRAVESVTTESATAGSTSDDAEVLSLESIETDGNPVVRLVSSVLYDALQQEASDVHLKSSPSGLSVKFRVDGVLVPISEVAGMDTAQRVISRIKVMSDLDIAERRVPQDGRFRVAVRGGHVDFRVSIMPSIHGEDAVLRLLDRSTLTGDRHETLKLSDLAMEAMAIATLRKLVAQPYGMVLVTGPTGSGKTTTLYAAIDEINRGEENIITIEDPVEYQLPGVLQIPVNEKKGLTFARGLRSILRHDPDKIMVGEIRDEDTAQIAVQAALTGHLVLTTVHANSVFDVVGRLLHMGVDAYSLASALVGVWAQRLIRINCTACAVPSLPDEETILMSGLPRDVFTGKPLKAGRGCGHCRGTGYRGRRAVAEYFVMNDRLRELIAAKSSLTQLRAVVAEQGGASLRAAALELFYRGETTLSEVNRVTFAE